MLAQRWHLRIRWTTVGIFLYTYRPNVRIFVCVDSPLTSLYMLAHRWHLRIGWPTVDIFVYVGPPLTSLYVGSPLAISYVIPLLTSSHMLARQWHLCICWPTNGIFEYVGPPMASSHMLAHYWHLRICWPIITIFAYVGPPMACSHTLAHQWHLRFCVASSSLHRITTLGWLATWFANVIPEFIDLLSRRFLGRFNPPPHMTIPRPNLLPLDVPTVRSLLPLDLAIIIYT